MRIESADRHDGPSRVRRWRSDRRRIVSAGIALLGYTVFLLLLVVWLKPHDRLHEMAMELGAPETVRLREILLRGPVQWLRAVSRRAAVPDLYLDIKFSDYQKLEAKRREALARGALVQGPDDFVPASIRYAGRSVRVKLRLKGDWTDHLRGDKWSFRVHVRGRDHLMGMRRFSLQHPRTRGYQSEVLFLDALRREDVLVPRYSFAEVHVNGRSIGLMAVEEHFSKELLEAQGRRESVILRFDESLVWLSNDGNSRGFGGAFDSYANATIDPFRATQVARSERLSADADVAIGLLRGFVEGDLPASAVFDAEKLGRFLAVSEVWGAVHAVRWHNLRFYYDPISAKLEPIGYDADAQHALPPTERLASWESFVRAVLEDARIRAVYEAATRRIAKAFETEKRREELERLENEVLAVLHREFPLIPRFPIENVRARSASVIAEGTNPQARAPGYATLVRAYLVNAQGTPYLELVNAVPQEVEIREIRRVAEGDHGRERFRPLRGAPRRLPPTPVGSVPRPVRVALGPVTLATAERVEVVSALAGDETLFVSIARPYPTSRDTSPIPTATLETALARHPFLRTNGPAHTVRVERGTWRVHGSLVLPEATNLVVPAGTTLRFDPDAVLIARGSVRIEGTAEAPVILEPTGPAGWKGVLVLDAASRSTWSHTAVRGTTGVGQGPWRLTGGVTFYRSPVRLDACVFEDSRTEDALNLVHSPFELDGVVIRGTVSDGLDVDFSDGVIEGGDFERIGSAGGGDAIDISGSNVRVSGTTIRHVSDKGLSVGERSRLEAERLTIQDVGTGAASKDGSELVLSDSKIAASRLAALMAYTKKPEYGPAHIEATRVTTPAKTVEARAQDGSSILLDGVDIPTEDLDVDALYRSTMRSGLRR